MVSDCLPLSKHWACGLGVVMLTPLALGALFNLNESIFVSFGLSRQGSDQGLGLLWSVFLLTYQKLSLGLEGGLLSLGGLPHRPATEASAPTSAASSRSGILGSMEWDGLSGLPWVMVELHQSLTSVFPTLPHTTSWYVEGVSCLIDFPQNLHLAYHWHPSSDNHYHREIVW